MWGWVLVMVWYRVAAVFVLTREEQGEVYVVRGKEAELVLSNLTLPTSSVADATANRLYVSSALGIYSYNLTSPNSSSEFLYGSSTVSGLALDVWGNLYFADKQLNTICVLYSGDTNVTILYDNIQKLRSPTAIVVDDFNELLYWANGRDGTLFGSIHLAFKEPFTSGRGDLASYLTEEVTESLVLSHNRIYVSASSGLYVSNKHNPVEWEQLPTLLGTPVVLSVYRTKVYLSDVSTGTLYQFREEDGAEGFEEVPWAPKGVTHMSVVLSNCAVVLAAVTWALAV